MAVIQKQCQLYGTFIFFVNNMTAFCTQQLKKQVIVWIDAWSYTDLPLDVVIQNWHDPGLTKTLTDEGYRVIHSPEGNHSS